MDRRENDNDMAANAWPGFVDILSAVIIMFVFFVMIIVVVLYIYTVKFTATVKQSAQDHIEESITKMKDEEVVEVENLEEKKKQISLDIESLEVRKTTLEKKIQEMLDQTSSEMIDGDQQKVIRNEKSLIILFEDGGGTLAEETILKVESFLGDISDKKVRVFVESGDDPDEVMKSNTRRQRLSRMLNVRNIMLSNGYDSDKIEINYAASEVIEGTYDWLRVSVE